MQIIRFIYSALGLAGALVIGTITIEQAIKLDGWDRSFYLLGGVIIMALSLMPAVSHLSDSFDRRYFKRWMDGKC